jgi:hypothetical protein
VAWDWVEIQRGVVAMSDPLGMVTNLRLLDERGEALSQLQIAVRLASDRAHPALADEVQRALHQPS